MVVRTQAEIVGECAPFSRLSGGKVLSRSVIGAAINFRGFCSAGHKSALSEVWPRYSYEYVLRLPELEVSEDVQKQKAEILKVLFATFSPSFLSSSGATEKKEA